MGANRGSLQAQKIKSKNNSMKIDIDRLDTEEIDDLGIEEWPVMEYDEEKLEWYSDKTEYCFIISGEATIISEFESITVRPGDFVTLPAGLECIWDVDTKIRKHYTYEE